MAEIDPVLRHGRTEHPVDNTSVIGRIDNTLSAGDRHIGTSSTNIQRHVRTNVLPRFTVGSVLGRVSGLVQAGRLSLTPEQQHPRIREERREQPGRLPSSPHEMLQARAEQQSAAILRTLGAVEQVFQGTEDRIKISIRRMLRTIAVSHTEGEPLPQLDTGFAVEETPDGSTNIKNLRGFTLRRAREAIDTYVARQQDPTHAALEAAPLYDFIDEQLLYQRDKMANLIEGRPWEQRTRTVGEIKEANEEIKKLAERRGLISIDPYEAQTEGDEVIYRYSVFPMSSQNLAAMNKEAAAAEETHSVSIRQKANVKRIAVYAFPNHTYNAFENNKSEFLVAGNGKQQAVSITVDGCDANIRNVDARSLTVMNGEVDAEEINLGRVVIENSKAHLADTFVQTAAVNNTRAGHGTPALYAHYSDFGTVDLTEASFFAEFLAEGCDVGRFRCTSDVSNVHGTNPKASIHGDVGIAYIENSELLVDGELGFVDAKGTFTTFGASEQVSLLHNTDRALTVFRTRKGTFKNFRGPRGETSVVGELPLPQQGELQEDAIPLEATIQKTLQADGIRRLLNSLDGIEDEQILADLRIISADLAQPWPEDDIPTAPAPIERADGGLQLQGIRDRDLRHALAAVDAYAQKILSDDTSVPVDIITLRKIITIQRLYQLEKLIALKDSPVYQPKLFTDAEIRKADEDNQTDIQQNGLVLLDVLYTETTPESGHVTTVYGFANPHEKQKGKHLITISQNSDIPVVVYGTPLKEDQNEYTILVAGAGGEADEIMPHPGMTGYTHVKVRGMNAKNVYLGNRASLTGENIVVESATVGSYSSLLLNEGKLAKLTLNGTDAVGALTNVDVGHAYVMSNAGIATDRSDFGKITMLGHNPVINVEADIGLLVSTGPDTKVPDATIDGQVGRVIKNSKDITEQARGTFLIIDLDERLKHLIAQEQATEENAISI